MNRGIVTKEEETGLNGRFIGLHQNGFLKDLLLTLAAAIWAGLAGAILLVLVVFALSGSAQAAQEEVTQGSLRLYSLDGRRIDDAPLLHTDVEIKITGMLARVSVKQQFINPTADWLEGIYQFPLPSESAVERLRMRIGERLIEGEIQERRKARASYERAKARGQHAALLSQERANIFTTSVANIAPAEKVQVEIEYQQSLVYDQTQFQLRFPLVIGPRYIPGSPLVESESLHFSGGGWAQATDQVRDASRISPPVVDPKNGPINPLSLSIRLDAGIELDSILSPYHELIQQQDDQGVYHLQLKQGSVPADRDFVLTWKPKVGHAPKAAIFSERWEGHEYALLMVLPPASESSVSNQPREVIFVLDTSGSMHGASLQQAKSAMQLALSRLDPRDHFNLIQFNSRTQRLFTSAVAATQQNLGQALDFLANLRADGGTEMLPALEQALDVGETGDRLRQVIFLTDGSVGNEQALFSVIRQRLGESRLFTIGIGSAPNSYFMQQAAAYGRGSFTYIGKLGEVASHMQALLQKLEHPVLTDLRLQWPAGVEPEIHPHKIPDLYFGEPLLMAFKADSLAGKLHIEGQSGSRLWRHTVQLQSGSAQTGVHGLWARRKIRDLMSELTLGRSAEEVRSEVLELALEHQLISRYTSLVAVDRTPVRPVESTLKSRNMPANLPHGWSPSRVFGQLPQTATPAPLHLLAGILLLLFGFIFRRISGYAG